MIIGAIAAVAGIASSVYGAVQKSKADKEAKSLSSRAAKQEALAARKAAKISKQILAEQKKTMDANIDDLKDIQKLQEAASEAVNREQDARKKDMLLDARFAQQATVRDYLRARGTALARASAQTGGVNGSGIFGALGQLWSSRNQALLEVNLDIETGLNIFDAQRDYADAISQVNSIQTDMSIRDMKSTFKQNKLTSRMNAAAVPKPVQGASKVHSLNSQAGTFTQIGGTLTAASGSIDRFGGQIFGTPTPAK